MHNVLHRGCHLLEVLIDIDMWNILVCAQRLKIKETTVQVILIMFLLFFLISLFLQSIVQNGLHQMVIPLKWIFYSTIFALQRLLLNSICQESNNIFLDWISQLKSVKLKCFLHELVLSQMLSICLDQFRNDCIGRFEHFDLLVERCYGLHVTASFFSFEDLFFENSVVVWKVLVSWDSF